MLYQNVWNLRLIIKNQFLQLLRYINIYRRKRHTVNSIKLEGERTKYFHAMATISYKKNVITQLKDSSGNFSY